MIWCALYIPRIPNNESPLITVIKPLKTISTHNGPSFTIYHIQKWHAINWFDIYGYNITWLKFTADKAFTCSLGMRYMAHNNCLIITMGNIYLERQSLHWNGQCHAIAWIDNLLSITSTRSSVKIETKFKSFFFSSKCIGKSPLHHGGHFKKNW